MRSTFTPRSPSWMAAAGCGLLLALALGQAGAQGLAGRAAEWGGRADLGMPGEVPAVTLRYRVTDRHHLFADAHEGRRLGLDPAAAGITTRVGIEWQPARSTLGFDHGALGVQLDSGYRLSLKARGGGPMLYLRGQF